MVDIGPIIRSLFPEKAALIDEGKCPICEQPVNPDEFIDELDKKEHQISGMCADCIHQSFSAVYDQDERTPYEGQD